MFRKLPENLSFDEAAGLNGGFETAYHGLIHCGDLKKGRFDHNVKYESGILTGALRQY